MSSFSPFLPLKSLEAITSRNLFICFILWLEESRYAPYIVRNETRMKKVNKPVTDSLCRFILKGGREVGEIKANVKGQLNRKKQELRKQKLAAMED